MLLFCFLGICAKGSRTSPKNFKQGKNLILFAHGHVFFFFWFKIIINFHLSRSVLFAIVCYLEKMSSIWYNDEQNSHLKGNINNFGHIHFCTSINIGGVVVLEVNTVLSSEQPQEGDTDFFLYLFFFFPTWGWDLRKCFVTAAGCSWPSPMESGMK